MADETKTTDTSDAALNAALETEHVEPAKEETVVETKAEEIAKEVKEIQEEVKKPEESDQQFRSRLGRRLSQLEDKFGKEFERLNSFVGRVEAQMYGQNLRQTDTGYQDTETGEFLTKKEAENLVVTAIKNLKTREELETMQYRENYLDHMARLGTEEGLNDAEFTRLEELLSTSFKTHKVKDPTLSAELNFDKAMRVIERERIAKTQRTVNLKGDDPKSVGVTQTAPIVDKVKPVIELDEHAKAFVKYAGMDEAKVAKALKGETPLSLRGKA